MLEEKFINLAAFVEKMAVEETYCPETLEVAYILVFKTSI